MVRQLVLRVLLWTARKNVPGIVAEFIPLPKPVMTLPAIICAAELEDVSGKHDRPSLGHERTMCWSGHSLQRA